MTKLYKFRARSLRESISYAEIEVRATSLKEAEKAAFNIALDPCDPRWKHNGSEDTEEVDAALEELHD